MKFTEFLKKTFTTNIMLKVTALVVAAAITIVLHISL